MKTVGQQLRAVRKIRKKTLQDLANETKIKKEFISLIERDQWNKLPDYPVVLGFVKSISNNLEINTENVVSLLKRDYPPQKLIVNPKPEMKEEFSWGPKLTFAVGVSAILLAVIFYLVFQYFRFLSPPNLEVNAPSQNAIITTDIIEVIGTTDPDVTVIVNDQPAFVDEEGNFYTEIEATDNLSELEIVAISRSDKETKKTISVSVLNQEEDEL